MHAVLIDHIVEYDHAGSIKSDRRVALTTNLSSRAVSWRTHAVEHRSNAAKAGAFTLGPYLTG